MNIKNFLKQANQAGSISLGDLSICRMGFGALHLTGPSIWGLPKNPADAHAVLRRAVELGVNFIDTADSYGPEISENMIAEALYPYPSDLVIATKGGLVRPRPESWIPLGRPEYLMQCVEMSLRRLRLDCIPLYQLHAIDPAVPLEDSLGALKEMQDQGKIRYIGLSNFSVPEIERAKKVVDIVSVQNQYNLGYRQHESVLKYCEKDRLAFIPWYPIGSGDLVTSRELQSFAKQKGITAAQLALAWLLKHSPAMVLIPGTSSIKHLEENSASAAVELSIEDLSTLERFFRA